MRYITFSFLMISSVLGYAQDRMDSMITTVLTSSDPTSTDVNAYNEIIKHLIRQYPDSAKLFIDRLAGAEQSDDYTRIMAKRWLGEYYDQLSSFDSAIVCFEQMLDMAQASGYDSLKAKAFYELGSTNIYLGNMPEAKENLTEALDLYEKMNHSIGVQDATYTLAVVYMYEEKYELALTSYLSLDTLMRKEENVDSVFLGSILHNVGYLYRQIKNYEKAEDYTRQALAFYNKEDTRNSYMLTYSLLAWIKSDKGQYKEAESDFLELLAYYENTKNDYSLAEVYLGLGTVAKSLENCENAIVYLKKAELINRRIGSFLNLATSQNIMASCYASLGFYEEATGAFTEADKLATENGSLILKTDAIAGLAEVSYQQGDHKKSSEYYDQLVTLKDSLNIRTNEKAVEELETKYQSEKKEQEIQLLTAQNQLAVQERKNQLYMFSGLSIGILVIAIFFYILYRNRQKTADKLRELDTVKSNFFANISHEFRTPLTLIKGPLQEQLSANDLDEKERSNLEIIDRSADRLLSLVDQLLDLSRLEAGSMKLQVQADSLGRCVRTLVPAFEYAADQKQIRFETDIRVEDDQSWFDRDAIEKIVVNLLSNAVKYTPEKETVQFSVSADDGRAKIRVRNTGTAVRKEDMGKVFDRFYQSDTAREGAGIGLALVQELVSLHGGTIVIDSDEVSWTQFEVQVPLTRSAYRTDQIKPTGTEAGERPSPLVLNDIPAKTEDPELSGDDPVLLIVEDNSDVRKLIRGLFDDSYEVLEAENGEEGISKALQYVPDIIISDVMMPVKDGVELSKTLKTDERTSHIPIILLTAKAGDENELKGLETGADDYITKPFNNELLKVRVQKLVELRAQLRSRYSQEVILRPKDIAVSSTDEKFLERVQQLLDERLTDPSFSAEAFSREIGMSRMQLHRKLKALVGLTTTEFIRSQRLKLAAYLLETSDINMSEVGYSVGFNDPSYFAKCFKEAYGSTPTQYASVNGKG